MCGGGEGLGWDRKSNHTLYSTRGKRLKPDGVGEQNEENENKWVEVVLVGITLDSKLGIEKNLPKVGGEKN